MMHVKFLAAASLLFVASWAIASTPSINSAYPDVIQVAPHTTEQISFTGDSIMPIGVPAKDVTDWTQFTYRRISPIMTDWEVASFNGVDAYKKLLIQSIGRDGFSVLLTEAMMETPGQYALVVCVKTAGCSKPWVITVSGQDPTNIVIADSSTVVDAGKSSPRFTLKTTGVQSVTTTIRLADWIIQGDTNLVTGEVMFSLPDAALAKPAFYSNILLKDPMGGTSQNALTVRVFGLPQLAGPMPGKIEQHLIGAAKASDATIEMQFAQMTFPTKVQIVDRAGAVHDVSVPLDLLSNHAKIPVSASYLVDGEYQLGLRLSNAGGSAGLSVPVSITRAQVTPIPHPLPHPTFVPGPGPGGH